MLINETLSMDYSKFISINRQQQKYGEGIFACSIHYYRNKAVEYLNNHAEWSDV